MTNFLPALFSALIHAAPVINKNSAFVTNCPLLWCRVTVSRCKTNLSHYIHAVFMFKNNNVVRRPATAFEVHETFLTLPEKQWHFGFLKLKFSA